MMRLLTPMTVLAACSMLIACSDTPDPNDPSQFDPNYNYQYPPQPGQPGQYPQPGQPGQYPQPGQPYPQPAQPQPGTPAPQPTGGGSGTATPLPPAAAAVAQPILTGLAGQEVQGMQPDGSSFAGQFQQGQTLEQPFQIQPGKCYSVIGVGVGITELDVQIVLHQPPLPPYIAAQDQGTGPQAVLGGRGNCFKNPLPVGGPAKVVMTATGGAGIAMAQVYSK
jgi:hypothetical protein